MVDQYAASNKNCKLKIENFSKSLKKSWRARVFEILIVSNMEHDWRTSLLNAAILNVIIF